ncbi:GNAT family N-acetyltransferase [Niabella sp. CC-SYL272]|uniref:GNAT family N-acetyltransferase n=1 Tax=Niabella agricola TaxID=2891571 RepID=UPI001F3E02CA|nr:GNAT family protein [Niabella agricola]MCF3111778.1 GNAT family N-acetyltransferase [Niabella agricola]
MNFRFSETIFLENEAVILQPLVAADAGHLLDIATEDPALLQFSPRQVYTSELLTAYIEQALTLRNNQARYSFSIYSKLAQCYAGSTSFLNISNEDDRLEIGATWIGNRFHGTGLNRHCKYLLLQYAFDTVQAHRVEFKTDERNLRSRKAIEKIGGIFEGLLREHTVMYDGHRRNTCCYSILKDEWVKLKASFLPDTPEKTLL